MKRIYYFLTLLMLAAVPMTFTSCDPDDGPWYDDWHENWGDDNGYGNNDNTSLDVAMAQVLNGQWTGTVVNEYYDDNNQYQKTQCYVDFTFTQYTADSNKGSGLEVDYTPLYDDNGNPVLDANGKQQYESQNLTFKWNFDSRSYMLYLTYDKSGMRFVIDTDPSKNEFFLGWDKNEQWDFFEAIMNDVNGAERATISCRRVTENNAAQRKVAKANAAASKPNAKTLSFGKLMDKSDNSNVPFAIRRR